MDESGDVEVICVVCPDVLDKSELLLGIVPQYLEICLLDIFEAVLLQLSHDFVPFWIVESTLVHCECYVALLSHVLVIFVHFGCGWEYYS